MIAAVGSVLSSLPLSDLTGPLESLTASHVDALQRLAVQQVGCVQVKKMHVACKRCLCFQPSMISHPLVMRELVILSALCHHIYQVYSA